MAKKKATKKKPIPKTKKNPNGAGRKPGSKNIPVEFREEMVELAGRMYACGNYDRDIKEAIRTEFSKEYPDRPLVNVKWVKHVMRDAKTEVAKEIDPATLKRLLVLVANNAEQELRDPKNKFKRFPARTIIELNELAMAAEDRENTENTETLVDEYKNNAFSQHTLAIDEGPAADEEEDD